MKGTDHLLQMQVTFLYEDQQQTDLPFSSLCARGTDQLNAISVPQPT